MKSLMILIIVGVSCLTLSPATRADFIITGRSTRGKVNQVTMPRKNILRGASGTLSNNYFSGPKAIRQDFEYTQNGQTAQGAAVPQAPEQTEAEKKYADQLFEAISKSPVDSNR